MESFKKGDEEYLLGEKVTPYKNDRIDGRYGGYEPSEDIDAAEKKPQKYNIKYNLKNLILGHFFLVLTLASFVAASISSQIALSENNILTINAIRFSVQALVAVIIGFIMKHSFKVKKEYWKYAIGGIVAHTAYGILFYFTMSSMPVGNTHALFIAFYAVFSTLVDLCRKVIDKVAVATTLIIVIGIIVLIQPWALNREDAVSILPCSLFQSHSLMTNHANESNITNNVTIFKRANGDTVQHQLIGYTCVVFTSICAVVYANLTKKLVSEYPFTVPNFLLGIFGAITAFVINVTQKEISEEPLFSFTDGTICTLFLCLFIISTLMGNLFETCCLKYIHVSERAASGSIQTVLLYVSQRTFLRQFHPGHANTVEVIGVVIITCSNIANIVNRLKHTDV